MKLNSIIKPNLLLGQHFLKSKNVLDEIIKAAELKKTDIVLEVGAGKGILTETLAAKVKKVIAVEKDERLVEYLKERFVDYKNIEIIQGDILKVSSFKFQVSNCKIVANLPYYITSRFLRLFLPQTKFRPKMMVLMMQKEVAQRICAKPPNMSLLALSVQAYAKPKIIMKVKPTAFKPIPSIDSAILKITDISDDFFKKNKIDSDNFFLFARKAFSQKRKMLRVSLNTRHSVLDKFDTKRPQELSLKDWAILIRNHKS